MNMSRDIWAEKFHDLTEEVRIICSAQLMKQKIIDLEYQKQRHEFEHNRKIKEMNVRINELQNEIHDMTDYENKE
jgi:hypothetical protein